MKRIPFLLMALLMAVALVGCGKAETLTTAEAVVQPAMAPAEAAVEPAAEVAPLAVTAAPAEAAPTAESGAPGGTVTGSAEGTVLAIAPNDITINMKNGNTINFMMNYITETDAMVGDEVTIAYSGDILNRPEAVTITVTEKAQQDQEISGTVMSYDDTRVFIAISSGNVFGFTLDKDSTVTGKAKTLNEGDVVTVTYQGELDAIPYAKNVEITTVAKAVKKSAEDKLKNKTLDGYVTALSDSKLTIHTNSGKNYSFKLTNDTKVTGNYSLEKGSKVRVTSDGYASKTPPAKIVKVLSPADPTPPKPDHHTTSGVVDSFYGVFLTLTNGSAFNCTYASYGGNSDGEEGDKAKVTYYIGDDGVYYATKVVFTAQDLSPDPEPEPDVFEEAE